MREEWRDIKDYEGLYQVSNFGNVRNLNYYGKTHRIELLKLQKTRDGYIRVGISKNSYQKFFRVHRLVAQAFIPNPLNLPQVNHKDENRSNNCVDNLEWCDAPYNSSYGTRGERISKNKSKPVYQYTLDGELVKIWSSTQECGRNGYTQINVSKCCRGILKKHNGYRWSYTPL